MSCQKALRFARHDDSGDCQERSDEALSLLQHISNEAS
jgi:hypothetical protein